MGVGEYNGDGDRRREDRGRTANVRLVLLLRAVRLDDGGRTANLRLVLLLRGAQLHGGRTPNVRLAALHACFFFCSPLFLFPFFVFSFDTFCFFFLFFAIRLFQKIFAECSKIKKRFSRNPKEFVK